jgi:23S rRNA (pseudouridine1915-N3)-methyltransferase
MSYSPYICNILLLFMLYSSYLLAYRFQSLSWKPISCTRRWLTTNIAVVGKKNSVEGWIASGIAEYEKRLRPVLSLNTIFLKNDDELVEYCARCRDLVIALDEGGKDMTSKEFSDYLYKSFELGGASVCFVIGGAEGLPASIRSSTSYPKISLSSMTWTHQMSRLLLIEQIYRATEIRKGSSYHKD